MAITVPIEKPTLNDSVPSGADLSAATNNFRIMKIASGVAQLAAVGDESWGVLQNNPTDKDTALIMVNGITRVQAGAVIGESVKIAPDANGKARVAVSGDHVVGITRMAAAADGDIISCLLTPGGAPLP